MQKVCVILGDNDTAESRITRLKEYLEQFREELEEQEIDPHYLAYQILFLAFGTNGKH